MRGQPGDAKENADPLAGEVGVQGIEALPQRVNRYGKAKKGALDVAEYIGRSPEVQRELGAVWDRLRTCGDYLVFRHYYTVDQVKLHGAQLCMKHLLCPLCAIRRGAKALRAYLDRWQVIAAQQPQLRAWLVTLTVKDGDDLAERFRHLHSAQRELWKRRHRGRGSVLGGVSGAVWSYEVKRGSGSGLWHPHLHMIALAEEAPDQVQLSHEWKDITGDSYVVDVREISQADPASGFIEVFKYAVKFSEQQPADTVHAFRMLKGKRLVASAGCFRGVEIPEDLTDDEADLADLPFVTLFYRYLAGGYNLENLDAGLRAIRHDAGGAGRHAGRGGGRSGVPAADRAGAQPEVGHGASRVPDRSPRHLRDGYPAGYGAAPHVAGRQAAQRPLGYPRVQPPHENGP